MFKFTPKNAILYLKFQARKTKSTLRKWRFKIFRSSLFKESLPNEYNFVLFVRAVSGKHALARFLSLCGLKFVPFFYENVSYLDEVKKVFKDKIKCYLVLGVYRSYRVLKGDYGRVIPNSSVLIMVRDPISRCKAMLNHGTPNRQKLIRGSNFPAQNLNTPPRLALDKKRYKHKYGYSNKAIAPSVNGLPYVLRRELNFTYFSSIKSLLNPSYNIKIHYIDTKELMPQKAFETMTNLAKQFNFDPPKEEDRSKIEQVIWNKIRGHLPFELELTSKDFSELERNLKLSVIESHYLKDYQNTQNCEEIKDFFIDSSDPMYAQISIVTQKENAKILLENAKIKARLKEYFKEFVKALEFWVKFREEKQVTEEQVLEYFKQNKNLRTKFKKMLDKELTHIKQTRPDIIASWKHYKEFEKICEEG